MKFDNIAVLQNTLEQMETQQLDAMLHEELKKEHPNGQLVRLIGSVLKEREQNNIPEFDANVQQAWERYQKKNQQARKKPQYMNSWLVRVASLILVFLTFVAILPQEASAKSFFERVIAWTEDVFSFVNPANSGDQKAEYGFRTENPGLQEVYEKVTELGVTVPVVPMWLPEGYELMNCETNNNPVKKTLLATFSDGKNEIIYQIDIYSSNVTHDYFKNELAAQTIEMDGTVYTLLQNHDLWVAVWTKENIECSLYIDCQENILLRILESIYTMEEK
jgi:hypothetical protein